MLSRLRKFVPLNFKKNILNSLPYRFYSRCLVGKKEIVFNVEITTKCNIKCEMCTRLDMLKMNKLKIGEISLVMMDKIVGQIKKFYKSGYKVTFAPMGLGDPLLYSSLEKTLKKIKKISKEIRIVLVTNGVALNEKIIKKLIELEVDEVSVSLNSNRRSSYREHMGIDAYQKVKDNIDKFINMRNKSERKLPRIYVQYLAFDNREERFVKDIEYWKQKMKYGDKCYVHRIVNLGGFKKSKDNLGIDDFPCNSPLSQVAIKINGDIYPCCACFYGGTQKIDQLFLGNIKKTDLLKMFKDSKSKNFEIVQKMKNRDYSSLPMCKKCDNYKLGVNYFFRNPFTGKWW